MRAVESLQALTRSSEPAELRLRAMWSLHIIGQLPVDDLLQTLQDRDESLRAWAIQLL